MPLHGSASLFPNMSTGAHRLSASGRNLVMLKARSRCRLSILPAPAREVGNKLRATFVSLKIGCARERNNPAVSVVSCRKFCSVETTRMFLESAFLHNPALRDEAGRGWIQEKTMRVTPEYIGKNLRCTQDQQSASGMRLSAAKRILLRNWAIGAAFGGFQSGTATSASAYRPHRIDRSHKRI